MLESSSERFSTDVVKQKVERIVENSHDFCHQLGKRFFIGCQSKDKGRLAYFVEEGRCQGK